MPGKRILFVTWDGTGNLPPQLSFAACLARGGHTARFLATESLKERIEGAGFAFSAYERVSDLYADPAALRSAEPWWTQLFFAPLVGEELLAEVRRRPHDAVVTDCLLWGALTAAVAAGVPAAVFVHTLYARFTTDLSGEAIETRLPLLNDYRRALGLRPSPSVLAAWDEADLVLVASARAFDVDQEVPANVHYIGPLRDDDSDAQTEVDPGSLDDERPLVIISFSTSRLTSPPLVQPVLDAVADVPVRGLLTTGQYLDAAALRVPENVIIRDYVPHSVVLPHAAAVVCHAGHGTVLAALSHGVPVLCLPLLADQPVVASRVAALGVGHSLPARADAPAIRASIAALLNRPEYKRAAEHLASAIATELAAKAAEAAVARLVSAADGPPLSPDANHVRPSARHPTA